MCINSTTYNSVSYLIYEYYLYQIISKCITSMHKQRFGHINAGFGLKHMSKGDSKYPQWGQQQRLRSLHPPGSLLPSLYTSLPSLYTSLPSLYTSLPIFLTRSVSISKIVRSYLGSKLENRLISLSRWVSRLHLERFT